VAAFLNWLKNYESVAIWLEGIALVLIFGLELKEYKRQGTERAEDRKDAAEQVAIARQAADAANAGARAVINAERAWVIAELDRVCAKVGPWWHRPIGSHWAPLSDEELSEGLHLMHRLKFTNMGRTPAHILRYRITYSCLDKGVTNLSGGTVARQDSEIIFDHLLSASTSVEARETVDVNKYMSGRIKGITALENTAVFQGWVEYQHVFSSEVIRAPFSYSYKPSTLGLVRVPDSTVY
jgi:hypothetical protein